MEFSGFTSQLLIKILVFFTVSSTTAPLKINTKENLPATEQPRAPAEASKKQNVAYKDTGPRMGSEKKKQLVKEDLKSLPKQKGIGIIVQGSYITDT